MLCPVCQQALVEQAPYCPHCQFHLSQADRVFGAVPVLDSFLNDFAKVLTDRDQRRVIDELKTKERRFPQVRFAAIITDLPAGTPFPAYVFWLFNRGNLSPQIESGANCRLVLIALDVASTNAVCMIGYGLEPFIGNTVLQSIAEACLPALEKADYSGAIINALDVAETTFTQISTYLPRAYGLESDDHEEADETAEEEFAY